MLQACAFDAHTSSELCARYAHDVRVQPVHNAHMDLEWFKERKRDLKLTDGQIGEAMGRDRTIANRLLNGKVVISRQHLDGLAKVFQVTKGEIAERAGIVDDAEEGALPSEEEMTEILAQIQAQMPAMLPTSEWPRYVAEALKLRLDTLSNDRSKADKRAPQA